jgi:hypothetical protein
MPSKLEELVIFRHIEASIAAALRPRRTVST